jgi:glycosyltransferase involved in cell wall biosynthesis
MMSEAGKSITFFRFNRVVDEEETLLKLECDIYFLMLRELMRRNILASVNIIYLGKKNREKDVDGLRLFFVTKGSDLPSETLDTHFLWVRGDKKEYARWLQQGKWEKRFFYGASSYYFPYRTYGYDGVLVDEKEHYSIIEKHYKRPVPLLFLKPANEQVFKKLENIPKKYDICIFSTVHKNPKAFLRLYGLFPQLNFVIVGRNDVPELAHLKDKENITFTGIIPYEDANKVLNQSKIGIVLSVKDGCPRVIIESMAAGLPQILDKNLMMGKSYLSDETGLLADKGDIKEKVELLLSNFQQMDPAAHYRKHFSLEKASDLLINNLQKIEALPRANKFNSLKIWLLNTLLVGKFRGHYLKRQQIEKFFPVNTN